MTSPIFIIIKIDNINTISLVIGRHKQCNHAIESEFVFISIIIQIANRQSAKTGFIGETDIISFIIFPTSFRF